MAHSCKQAIINEISACGPQSIARLRRVCREQATDYGVTVFFRAVQELVNAGAMERDTEIDNEIVYTNGC